MSRVFDIAIVTAALVTGVPCAQAQQWEPVDATAVRQCLQRNDQQYAAMTNMRLTTLISAYQNAGDAVPNDKGSSIVWRTGDSYKAEHLGLTTYQDKDLRLVIDSDERTILLSAPTDLMTTMRGAIQDSLLARAVRIGRTSMGDGTHFRLKFGPGALYDVAEIVFDGQGWLRHVDLFWAQPVPIDPSDPDSPVVYPKVSLALGVPERIAPGTVNTDPGSVISWRNGEPVALGSWKDYSVFDTRPK